VEGVLFSPDGGELLTASGLSIHAWYTPSGDLPNVPVGKGSPAESAKTPSASRDVSDTSVRQRDNLAFLTYRPGEVNRRAFVEDSLGRQIELGPGRMEELAAALASEELDDNSRLRAAVELSAYEKDAAAVAPQIV